MTDKGAATNVADTSSSYFADHPLNALRPQGWLVLLDVALLVTSALLIFTEAKVLFFHVVFVLLTVGAFYWNFRGFLIRSVFWVTVTTMVVLATIMAGETQPEELIEIPMLTTILILVFAVARQRAQADEALRKSNELLESRVAERTTELTEVNARLTHEIGQHRKTEATLRESEERYRGLVELSFEGIGIHSQGVFRYANPQAVKLLGAESADELIGKPIRDFVHPDYWDLVEARIQQIGEESRGVPLIEEKYIRLDGTSVDVEVAAIPITYQGQPAIQSVMHDISARKKAETERERERARIARDLHASLGHSLAYLHLKLDTLAGDQTFRATGGLRDELARMRDVANQAYEVVRGMLAAALPSNASDLATAMLVEARAIGRRANFEVQISREGQSRPLPPVTQQQILYLFKEALINVERHADARSVNIRLIWDPDALTVILSDDGKGFAPDEVGTNGHLGLAIMQECAQEIKGRVSVGPGPEMGTQVTLWLPLESSPGPLLHLTGEERG